VSSPSPPAEKATTRQDQAGKSSTSDGGGHYEAEIIGGFKQLARGGKMLIVRPETAKPTVEISDRARLNLEKFVWSSREK
jgi:hypothetical protein